LECWEPSQHLLIGTGKPRKTCVEVAGRRTFRILTSSQQSGILSKIIIIFINCNWVVTRWQWLFYMYTKYEIGY